MTQWLTSHHGSPVRRAPRKLRAAAISEDPHGDLTAGTVTAPRSRSACALLRPVLLLALALVSLCAVPHARAQNESPADDAEVVLPPEAPVSLAQTQDAAPSPSGSNTYIIPVDGMIERGLLYAMRRGINEALKNDAGAIILDMNTPGGSVAVTEEIIRLLISLPDDVHTYTYVNKDALSAGALISMATRTIYMSPGSRIGASAIVTLFGDIEEGDMKEKHVSSLVALISSAAQRNGHDPALVEAMVRRDAEYRIGDEVLCEEGKLLTLTELQATRLIGEGADAHPLLAAGVADSLDDMLKAIGRDTPPPHRLVITWSESVARWIEMFSVLFLIGGILGLYVEFKVPGFGLPGFAGITCLAIFFWGHHVAGLAGAEELIVFLLGGILLAIEIFLIPGFGITGVAGITLMFTALLMAMVQHYPGGPLLPPPAQFHLAARNLSIAIIVAFFLVLILARYFPETHAFRRIMLTADENRERGFQSSSGAEKLVGRVGMAETDLRPGGIGVFDGKRLDVITHGDFVERGRDIVIAETHGNRIVVEPVGGSPGLADAQA